MKGSLLSAQDCSGAVPNLQGHRVFVPQGYANERVKSRLANIWSVGNPQCHLLFDTRGVISVYFCATLLSLPKK